MFFFCYPILNRADTLVPTWTGILWSFSTVTRYVVSDMMPIQYYVVYETIAEDDLGGVFMIDVNHFI